MHRLPTGWTESGWNKLQAAEATPEDNRTDEQWEIIDRPRIWSDEDAELYALGAAEAIDP